MIIEETGKLEDKRKKVRELNEQLEVLRKVESQKGENVILKFLNKDLGVELENKARELNQKRQMADQRHKEYKTMLSVAHNANVSRLLDVNALYPSLLFSL